MQGSYWAAQDIQQATGGRLQGNTHWEAAGFSIDSRTVDPGECYIALKGERHDGHAFLAQAWKAGAAAAIVSDITHVPEGMPVVIVQDTLQALQALGQWRQRHGQATIIGITGSVGKTGSKELLRHMLEGQAKAYATSGNYNNHIGLPLCLANMPVDTEIGIFEMGMNHAGEIAALTVLAEPNISVITTVEAVHLEHFHSVEGIARAKAEIFTGQRRKDKAVAILPLDNPHYSLLYQSAQHQQVHNILTFGESEQADCRLEAYTPLPIGADITLRIGDLPMNVRIGASGKHWASLASAALLVVEAIGGDLPQAAASLAHFVEPAGRGRRTPLRVQEGQAVLIDDSYNASPVSMQAAFTALQETPVANGGRRIAVLGDMLELGNQSSALHCQLKPLIVAAGIDKVFTVGGYMKELQASLPENLQGGHCERPETLLPLLTGYVQPNDLILVKGSHGSRMHWLAGQLLKGALAGEKESVDAV